MQRRQGFYQAIFDGVEAVKDQVGEPFFPYFLPQVLDRVELGTVGRQSHQTQVVGDFEIVRAMPPCAIDYDEEDFLRALSWRLSSYLLEEARKGEV